MPYKDSTERRACQARYRTAHRVALRERGAVYDATRRVADAKKHVAHVAAWRAARPEEAQLAKGRAYRAKKRKTHEYRVRCALDQAAIRARAKELTFDLTYEWLIAAYPATGLCPVLGIQMAWSSGNGRARDASPSLDRFDNARGYTKDNVRWISMRANSLKSDAAFTELTAVLAYMKGDPPCPTTLQ